MEFSRLMLGTVQFGLKYGINNTLGRPSLDTVKAILRAAADGGINVLDTARNYGESEEVLGKALTETGLDKHFRIVSKVRAFPDDITPDAVPGWIEESVTTSLRLLQRNSLDGLLLHHEKDLPFLAELDLARKKHWTKAFGASLDSVAGSPAKYTEALTMVQVPGNILDGRFWNVAREVKARGGAVFVRSVYLQGLLFKPAAEIREKFGPVLEVRNRLETLSREAGIVPAELYFRYLLSLPMVDCVLTGVDSVDQLKQNLEVASRGPLPSDVLAEISRIVPELPEKYIRPSCWKSL